MFWLGKEDEEKGPYSAFQDQYARARKVQVETLIDEIMDIADDGSNDYMTITKGDKECNVEDKEVTSRSKMCIDARKWYASKVLPKKYGEKLALMDGDGKPLPVPDICIFIGAPAG